MEKKISGAMARRNTRGISKTVRRTFRLITGSVYHRKTGFRLLDRNIYLPRLKILRGKPKLGVRPGPVSFGMVEVAPFKFDCSGALCFSSDFELLWAFIYAGEHLRKRGDEERLNVPRILKMLDEWGVPVTWAAVGHLFLSSCKRDNSSGLAHPDMPRPKRYYNNAYWKWTDGDWYQHDPCSDFKKDPNWYAPDLIKKILKSDTGHEFGIHSFSHVDFSNRNCDRELARAELKKCIGAMAAFGQRPTSMVFPGNIEGNHDALAEVGINAFRGFDSIDISYPERTEDGLWNIRQSIFLFADPDEDYLARSLRFIRSAMDNNMVCHISFHPSELTSKRIEDIFGPILDFAAAQRSERSLWIATMAEIASYCECRQKINVTAEHKENILHLSVSNKIDTNRYALDEITFKIKLDAGSEIRSVKVDDKKLKIGTSHCFNKVGDRNSLILTVPMNVRNIEIGL